MLTSSPKGAMAEPSMLIGPPWIAKALTATCKVFILRHKIPDGHAV